jgi:hypothetical protein
MDSINDKENGLSFSIFLEKPGPFFTLRLEVSDENYTYFISSDMIIPKPTLESMIEHIRDSGTVIDNINRFDLKDTLGSYLIIFDGARQIVGRAHNIVTGKFEDFHATNLDKDELMANLQMQFSRLV